MRERMPAADHCWIIDVETPERAYQLATQASAALGVDGKPLHTGIEVRQVMSGPDSGP